MHVCIKTDYFSITFFSVAPYNVNVMGTNTYTQGSQLQLTCVSEGGPELKYTWLMSGSMIDNVNDNTYHEPR